MMDEYKDLVPVLSESIEFNQLSDDEYILSNVQDRHYIKINKDVYQALSLIDGDKKLELISGELKERYDKEISTKQLYDLLYGKLIPYGILKGFEDKVKPYKKPPYLKLSFIIINEKTLNHIVNKFHFLFHKKVAITTLFAAIAFISAVFYLKLDVYRTFDVQSCFVYFVVLMALSVTFHEIGHATAASYFGANHGGIGGGFYLFKPVYYADVTDIWRLKKTQRIIVNLAGIYFELLFSSVLLLIGLIVDNYMFTFIPLVISVSTLFNLNPFMRSDGFWVISDLINKPNLFQHSIKRIAEIFRCFFSRKPVKWKFTDCVLIMYGLVSYLFMGIFLYYVLIKDASSVLYFPKRFVEFIKNLVSGGDFSVDELMRLLIPLMFYLLIFNLIKTALKKFAKIF
jgi:putative peptide zinc metalloprotease protein